MIGTNKIRIVKYDHDLLSRIRDEKIIVVTDSINNLELQYKDSLHDKEVIAMVIKMPYLTIAQLELDPNWETIPIVIYAYNVGSYDSILRNISLFKRMNMRIYLSGDCEDVFTDLKFLSSLGIDCGLDLTSCNTIYDDKLLDFASYYYLSQGKHASVEPFEFILKHINDDENKNFSQVFFNDPLLFISDLEDNAQSVLNKKLDSYYSHFINLDDCAKCAAFKICDYNMQHKLNNCSATMSDLFEMAELRSKLDIQYNTSKTVCQL